MRTIARNNCRSESSLASPVFVEKENNDPQQPMTKKEQLKTKAKYWLKVCQELERRAQEVIDAAQKLVAVNKSAKVNENLFSRIVRNIYIDTGRTKKDEDKLIHFFEKSIYAIYDEYTAIKSGLLSPKNNEVMQVLSSGRINALSLTNDSLKRIKVDRSTKLVDIDGDEYLRTTKCFQEFNAIFKKLEISAIQDSSIIATLGNYHDTLDNMIMNELRKCALLMEETLFQLFDIGGDQEIANVVLNDDSKNDTFEEGITSDGSFLKSSKIKFLKTNREYKWRLLGQVNPDQDGSSGLNRLKASFSRYRMLDPSYRKNCANEVSALPFQTGGGDGRERSTSRQAKEGQNYSSIYFSEADMNRKYTPPPLTTFGFLYTGGKQLPELVEEAVKAAQQINFPSGVCSSSDLPETSKLEGEHLLLPESTRLLLQNRPPITESKEPSRPRRKRSSQYQDLVSDDESEEVRETAAIMETMQVSQPPLCSFVEGETEDEEEGKILPSYLFVTAAEESENVKKIKTTAEGVTELQAFGRELASIIITMAKKTVDMEKRALFLTNILLQIRRTSEEDKIYLYQNCTSLINCFGRLLYLLIVFTEETVEILQETSSESLHQFRTKVNNAFRVRTARRADNRALPGDANKRRSEKRLMRKVSVDVMDCVRNRLAKEMENEDLARDDEMLACYNFLVRIEEHWKPKSDTVPLPENEAEIFGNTQKRVRHRKRPVIEEEQYQESPPRRSFPHETEEDILRAYGSKTIAVKGLNTRKKSKTEEESEIPSQQQQEDAALALTELGKGAEFQENVEGEEVGSAKTEWTVQGDENITATVGAAEEETVVEEVTQVCNDIIIACDKVLSEGSMNTIDVDTPLTKVAQQKEKLKPQQKQQLVRKLNASTEKMLEAASSIRARIAQLQNLETDLNLKAQRIENIKKTLG